MGGGNWTAFISGYAECVGVQIKRLKVKNFLQASGVHMRFGSLSLITEVPAFLVVFLHCYAKRRVPGCVRYFAQTAQKMEFVVWKGVNAYSNFELLLSIFLFNTEFYLFMAGWDKFVHLWK